MSDGLHPVWETQERGATEVFSLVGEGGGRWSLNWQIDGKPHGFGWTVAGIRELGAGLTAWADRQEGATMMSDELKERMEYRRKGIRPPYWQDDLVGKSVIFPGWTNTTCNMVVDDVWKAAWDEAQRVVDDWQQEQDSGPAKENPNTRPIRFCNVWRHHVPHEHYDSPGQEWYWCEGRKVCDCEDCQDPDKPLPEESREDDEVNAIKACYDILSVISDTARKRAIYYLHERFIGLSDE
jgi:hypothetical protein